MDMKTTGVVKTKEEAVMDAWKQIQEYCKERYAGRVGNNGTWIDYKYDDYFNLLPNGEPYLSGGTGCLSYRYYHPTKSNDNDNRTRIAKTEMAIQHWDSIKRRLEKKIYGVYNFKV